MLQLYVIIFASVLLFLNEGGFYAVNIPTLPLTLLVMIFQWDGALGNNDWVYMWP